MTDFQNYQHKNNPNASFQHYQQPQNASYHYESQKTTNIVHIVDDFLTELTVDTGSEYETSVDSEEMDENIQMFYKE